MRYKSLTTIILVIGIVISVNAQENEKIPKLRISVSGGLGYLTAAGQKDSGDSSNNDLSWVKNLNGDIHYLFHNNLGVGVKYLFHNTSSEAYDVILDIDPQHYGVTDILEKDYLNFIGPSLISYKTLGKNNNIFLISSISVGYAWFRSELHTDELFQNILISGNNFGTNVDIGIDYLFTSNLGIGVNFGVLGSFFRKIKISNGTFTEEVELDKNSQYNASNIYLSVGIRYYINK